MTKKSDIGRSDSGSVVRQTFIIGTEYLDRLKDLVYTKKRSGQFEYSQKDALHEGLELLFAKNKITRRPEEIRIKEEHRSTRIKEGKK